MGIEMPRRSVHRIHVGRLIDGTAAEPLDDAAVLVVDDRIAAVGHHNAVPTPEDARLHELPGATALPGLMDAHVHVTLPPTIDPLKSLEEESDHDLVIRGAAAAERMVRAGVTTAYDCGARGRTAQSVRDAIARRLVLGPRLLVSGPAVTQPGGHCHFFGGEADGVPGLRAIVRRLIEEEGVDGIKMIATGGGLTPGTDSRYATYSVEELAAAADEAHLLGKRVTAHAHGVPGIRNVSEAGIDSVQHCTMLGEDWGWSFDEGVAVAMARRGTRACPTISAGYRNEVESGININELQPNPGAMDRHDWWANARRLIDCGVTIVPGTDVGINLTDFGDELFLELEAYARIGVPPLDVVRWATARSAWHHGIDGVTGTLRQGLEADVLVVDGSPDRDISDLRRTQLVFRAGRAITPTPPPPPPVGHTVEFTGA
jgi:imidazolonepropionase-like amidohydrolase